MIFYIYDNGDRQHTCDTILKDFYSVNFKKGKIQNTDDKMKKIKELLNNILKEDMSTSDFNMLNNCLKTQKDSNAY